MYTASAGVRYSQTNRKITQILREISRLDKAGRIQYNRNIKDFQRKPSNMAKKKKRNSEYRKSLTRRFIKRLVCFFIIEILILYTYVSVQRTYEEANADNTEQKICKIDDIYLDTWGRHNIPYHIVADSETYLFFLYDHPASMKDVKEQLMREPSVQITVKRHKKMWLPESRTFEIVDIRTDDHVYFDIDHANSWNNEQRPLGNFATVFGWISYTVIAGYILIFYRGEKVF
jgi:hypothetical protein